MNQVLHERGTRVALAQACRARGLNRSSVYARRNRVAHGGAPRTTCINARQARALNAPERQQVLDTLHSDAFADQPPGDVYSQLLEQRQCLCSVSTMHRVLRGAKQNGERRAQRPTPNATSCSAATAGPAAQ
jgi:putative transposase